jgi:hypothetical protein
VIALLVVGCLVALVGFVVLEERGRPDVAVVLAVAVVVIDALLFPQQEDVPVGLWRPELGGQDLRLVDAIILAALGARLLVRGLPRRVTGEGLIWTAFFAWYAFAGLIGLAQDQPSDLLLFQEKLVLQTGGMIVLAAGVPLGRLASRGLLNRLGVIGGAVCAVVLSLAAAGASVTVPLGEGAQLGSLKPDAATLLFSLGTIVLVTSGCRERVSLLAVAGGAVMVAAPLLADQRAAIAGAIPVVIVIALAMNGRTWQGRSRLRPSALLPVVAALLVPVGVIAAAAASDGEGASALPLGARLEDTFASEQKQQSADVRYELLQEGLRLTGERPLLGHGLGQPVTILDEGADDLVAIGDFHDILLDLSVRTGLVGLGLFVLAVAMTLRSAMTRWRDLANDVRAALVLAAGAALGGLLVKGLFETVFQKFRLAVLLGLLVGIVIAAAREPRREHEPVAVDVREPAWI